VTEQGHANVAREKCYSYAICMDILPEVFQLDEMDISVARSDALSPLASLVNAAEECPMQAISVVASDGREIYPGS